MIHHQIKTRDDVTIHVLETGNPSRPAVLFVHGISQSWRSWLAQFADPRLRDRFRLVALDLRGHGESQGAFGAVDQEGNPLPALADERYNDGNVETTCRLWAYDLEATIEALRLDHPAVVGWSAGGWAVQSYLFTHGGLGAIGKAMLYASFPVKLAPGMADGGVHLSVRPEARDAIRRTTTVNLALEPPLPNDDLTVATGLIDFVGLCFSDETGRPVSSADIQVTTAFNLLTPPQVRLLLVRRRFDFRPWLAALPDGERERIVALTPQGDRVHYAEAANTYWDVSRIRNVRVPREGHSYHVRSACAFNEEIIAFAS
jgi:non-heme chloroperoxidase